jgi:glycerol-3-phosphate dehydrogenase (NAD(P)+)
VEFGIIGSGSWATALAKILTDNGNTIQWCVRNPDTIHHIQQRHHNPHYLSNAYFNVSQLQLTEDVREVVAKSEVVVIAVPSAYIEDVLSPLDKKAFQGKKIISAIKGILPSANQLLNEYLKEKFAVREMDYFTVLGPCHAEEIAAEKLSYLTFSGNENSLTAGLARYFKTDYINTNINPDIMGVQYAAVLKNIYALGAGIAHGLEYGDNFLSVYIAKCADEMTVFLKQVLSRKENHPVPPCINYTASVYLGDLLVTCYSLYSRNRTFGNMIGKGYSVKAAQLELNMVAEGYNASRCIYKINQSIQAEIPVAVIVYRILWEQLPAAEGFKKIESLLV